MNKPAIASTILYNNHVIKGLTSTQGNTATNNNREGVVAVLVLLLAASWADLPGRYIGLYLVRKTKLGF